MAGLTQGHTWSTAKSSQSRQLTARKPPRWATKCRTRPSPISSCTSWWKRKRAARALGFRMAAQNSTGWILSVAARSKCPRCGQGRLFNGFGYRVSERALHSVDEHAALVRDLFSGYLELGSVAALKRHLDQSGI